MALRLPRFDSSLPLTKDNNTPSIPFHQWWQLVVESIESSFNQLADLVDDIQAAIVAAGIAIEAANNAQAAGDSAQAAASAATSSSANAEKIASLTNSGVTGLTLTATDVGTDVELTISSHARIYGDGSTVSVNSGTLPGLVYGTPYYVFYDDPSRTGGAVTYITSTVEGDATQVGDRHFVGYIVTPAAAAPPSNGQTPRPPGIGALV